MKKTYFTILTLLAISYPNAALPERAPLASLGGNQKENTHLISIRSATPTESDAGSVTSRFTTTSTNNRYQLPTSEQLKTASQITKAFVELRKEYINLLSKMQRKDGRINSYLSEQINTLRSIPEVVECAEAGERKDKTLESAIHKLILMYRTLEGVANSEVTSATSGVETATNRTAELEETIASLITSMAELQTLMETMAPRPTVHMDTGITPARAQKMVAAEEEVENLRDRNAALQDALDAATARAICACSGGI